VKHEAATSVRGCERETECSCVHTPPASLAYRDVASTEPLQIMLHVAPQYRHPYLRDHHPYAEDATGPCACVITPSSSASLTATNDVEADVGSDVDYEGTALLRGLHAVMNAARAHAGTPFVRVYGPSIVRYLRLFIPNCTGSDLLSVVASCTHWTTVGAVGPEVFVTRQI
jgi:hypothetical protein